MQIYSTPLIIYQIILKLYLDYNFDLELNNLQKSLEKLYLPTYYNMKIKKYKSKMCYK